MLKGKVYNKEESNKLYGGWKLLTNNNWVYFIFIYIVL